MSALETTILDLMNEMERRFDTNLYRILADAVEENGELEHAKDLRQEADMLQNHIDEGILKTFAEETKCKTTASLAAANLRRIAKRAGIKCRITSGRYSSITITRLFSTKQSSDLVWERFCDLADKFECGRFCKHMDETEYAPKPFNTLYGGAKWINITIEQ